MQNKGSHVQLKGKTAIITGSSSGIGQATAELFAKEGARVAVVSGSSKSKAENVCKQINRSGGEALPFQIDVGNVSEINQGVAAIKAKLGPVDILVNCAGVYFPTALGSTTEEEFNRMVNIHLKGTFFMIQAVAPDMKSRKSGRIVNVASAAAFKGSAAYPLYATVKAGIVMLTRSLALDLAPFGVGINAIAPGNTETPINSIDRASAEIMATKRAATPSSRIYSPPSEMAQAILFFADGKVTASHGSTLILDEGLTA